MRQRGEDAVAVMRAIKHALDPQDLLNPGRVARLNRALAVRPVARQPSVSTSRRKRTIGQAPSVQLEITVSTAPVDGRHVERNEMPAS